MYANVCGFLSLRVNPKTVAATSLPSASVRCRGSPPCAWVTSLPALRRRLRAAAESRLAKSSESVRAPGLSVAGGGGRWVASPSGAKRGNRGLAPPPPPPPTRTRLVDCHLLQARLE